MNDFDLRTPSGAFKFFFELHNLASAFPPDGELSKAKDQLDILNQQVVGKRLSGFTSNRSKPNSNAPPGDNTTPFGNLFIGQQLSNAGYQLLPEVPVEGWMPLNAVASLLI